jgi:hypothetical protein
MPKEERRAKAFFLFHRSAKFGRNETALRNFDRCCGFGMHLNPQVTSFMKPEEVAEISARLRSGSLSSFPKQPIELDSKLKKTLEFYSGFDCEKLDSEIASFCSNVPSAAPIVEHLRSRYISLLEENWVNHKEIASFYVAEALGIEKFPHIIDSDQIEEGGYKEFLINTRNISELREDIPNNRRLGLFHEMLMESRLMDELIKVARKKRGDKTAMEAVKCAESALASFYIKSSDTSQKDILFEFFEGFCLEQNTEFWIECRARELMSYAERHRRSGNSTVAILLAAISRPEVLTYCRRDKTLSHKYIEETRGSAYIYNEYSDKENLRKYYYEFLLDKEGSNTRLEAGDIVTIITALCPKELASKRLALNNSTLVKDLFEISFCKEPLKELSDEERVGVIEIYEALLKVPGIDVNRNISLTWLRSYMIEKKIKIPTKKYSWDYEASAGVSKPGGASGLPRSYPMLDDTRKTGAMAGAGAPAGPGLEDGYRASIMPLPLTTEEENFIKYTIGLPDLSGVDSLVKLAESKLSSNRVAAEEALRIAAKMGSRDAAIKLHKNFPSSTSLWLLCIQPDSRQLLVKKKFFGTYEVEGKKLEGFEKARFLNEDCREVYYYYEHGGYIEGRRYVDIPNTALDFDQIADVIALLSTERSAKKESSFIGELVKHSSEKGALTEEDLVKILRRLIRRISEPATEAGYHFLENKSVKMIAEIIRDRMKTETEIGAQKVQFINLPEDIRGLFVDMGMGVLQEAEIDEGVLREVIVLNKSKKRQFFGKRLFSALSAAGPTSAAATPDPTAPPLDEEGREELDTGTSGAAAIPTAPPLDLDEETLGRDKVEEGKVDELSAVSAPGMFVPSAPLPDAVHQVHPEVTSPPAATAVLPATPAGSTPVKLGSQGRRILGRKIGERRSAEDGIGAVDNVATGVAAPAPSAPPLDAGHHQAHPEVTSPPAATAASPETPAASTSTNIASKGRSLLAKRKARGTASTGVAAPAPSAPPLDAGHPEVASPPAATPVSLDGIGAFGNVAGEGLAAPNTTVDGGHSLPVFPEVPVSSPLPVFPEVPTWSPGSVVATGALQQSAKIAVMGNGPRVT